MNDETRPQADQITAAPAPLEEQLRDCITAFLREESNRNGSWVDPDSTHDSFGFDGFMDVAALVDALLKLLADAGHVLPGLPPASKLLADAQEFAERVILAELAVRLFRTLVLGNLVVPDTPAAMDWLRDWIDGTLRGHGPIGKPMIWPDRIPWVAQLLREWGFQPTPSVPPYVMRKPQQPQLVIEVDHG